MPFPLTHKRHEAGRRRLPRLAAGCVVALLAAAGAIGTALPADAADPSGITFSHSRYITGPEITWPTRPPLTIETELMDLDVPAQNGASATSISAYCVQLNNNLEHDASYETQPWSAQSRIDTDAQQKIQWIIGHAFPAVPIDQLPAMVDGVQANVTKAAAVEATQLAIWHFSDGVTQFTPDRNRTRLPDPGDVTALYDYYTGAANVGADGAVPQLSIDAAPAGTAGGRIGPFTVHFDGSGEAAVSLVGIDGGTPPSGLELVDASGSAVTSAADGAELYVTVPAGMAPGSVQIDAGGVARVPAATLLVGSESSTTQELVTAASQRTGVSATATASWVDPPLIVTTTSLPDGVVGQPYHAALTASGGSDDAYTWTLADGQLPAGLTLSDDGTISGTPDAAGTATFTVSVNDPVLKQLTLTVAAAAKPAASAPAALAATGSNPQTAMWAALLIGGAGALMASAGIARRRAGRR